MTVEHSVQGDAGVVDVVIDDKAVLHLRPATLNGVGRDVTLSELPAEGGDADCLRAVDEGPGAEQRPDRAAGRGSAAQQAPRLGGLEVGQHQDHDQAADEHLGPQQVESQQAQGMASPSPAQAKAPSPGQSKPDARHELHVRDVRLVKDAVLQVILHSHLRRTAAAATVRVGPLLGHETQHSDPSPRGPLRLDSGVGVGVFL